MADEARFALHGLVVKHGVVLSWMADSLRAIAHESGAPIGFLDVA
jgi:glycerol kinase